MQARGHQPQVGLGFRVLGDVGGGTRWGGEFPVISGVGRGGTEVMLLLTLSQKQPLINAALPCLPHQLSCLPLHCPGASSTASRVEAPRRSL